MNDSEPYLVKVSRYHPEFMDRINRLTIEHAKNIGNANGKRLNYLRWM